MEAVKPFWMLIVKHVGEERGQARGAEDKTKSTWRGPGVEVCMYMGSWAAATSTSLSKCVAWVMHVLGFGLNWKLEASRTRGQQVPNVERSM
jgi:hypothetical protein